MEEEKIDCPYCPSAKVDATHIAQCLIVELKKKRFAPRRSSASFPTLSLAQIARAERIFQTTPVELIEGLWLCVTCGTIKVRVGAPLPKKCPSCRGGVMSGLLFMEILAREKK
jgi:DNA-directed RNA polymerase subunit RPC12/RpoP